VKGFVIGIAAAMLAMRGMAASADEKPPEKPAAADAKKPEIPRPEQSVTQHSVVIGGAAVPYTATAGTLIVRNEKDEPWASVGYTAYTRKDAGGASRRPITFAYNGGPGSSSIWLHMGTLGPRRVVTSDAMPTPPPPYQLVDNASSILDVTDLVMIDPVGTGFSKAVGDAKDKDFWGVDPDIESVSRFIQQYVSDNGRWNSPKYLLGESYGTLRSAGIVDYLQTRAGMAFNGVMLVSVAMDLGAIRNFPGNDRVFPLYLPTFTATAWYHKVLPGPARELEPLLAEVRKFALNEYATALLKGNALPAAERAAIIQKLHEYTGLSESYLDLANLRVGQSQFTQELMRQHRITVGRLDSRFTGVSFDPLAERAEYDPQSAAISGAYTAAFLNYLHDELKFGSDKTYRVSADVGRDWDWKHKPPGAERPLPTLPNTGLDLAHALGYNPNLRVMVLNGYYDMATPFLATESMVQHLGLEKELQPHVEMKYYPAGHMMYVYEPSLKAFKADVAEFIGRTARAEK